MSPGVASSGPNLIGATSSSAGSGFGMNAVSHCLDERRRGVPPSGAALRHLSKTDLPEMLMDPNVAAVLATLRQRELIDEAGLVAVAARSRPTAFERARADIAAIKAYTSARFGRPARRPATAPAPCGC